MACYPVTCFLYRLDSLAFSLGVGNIFLPKDHVCLSNTLGRPHAMLCYPVITHMLILIIGYTL